MIGGRFSHESHEEKTDAHLGKGFQIAAKDSQRTCAQSKFLYFRNKMMLA